MEDKVDVTITRQGTLMGFTCHTDAARDWFKENVHTEVWQYTGDTLWVDHRFAWELAEGAMEAGLEVRVT